MPHQVFRPSGLEVAPVSLLPMPFPRQTYLKVKDIMRDFNTLVHKVKDRMTRRGELMRPTGLHGPRVSQRASLCCRKER
eukprot:322119-Hanusia_phi.AAC.5